MPPNQDKSGNGPTPDQIELAVIKDRQEQDEKREEDDSSRRRWVIGITVSLFLALFSICSGIVGTAVYRWADAMYLEVAGVRSEISGLKTGQADLKQVQLEQAADIKLIRLDLSYQKEQKVLIDALNKDIGELKLEVERLKKP